jgi:hypothetical protein
MIKLSGQITILLASAPDPGTVSGFLGGNITSLELSFINKGMKW